MPRENVDAVRKVYAQWARGHMSAGVEMFAAGEDQVVVVADERGQRKGSGAPLERRSGTIFSLRGGRLMKLKFFGTPEDALDAAGLSE